MSEFLISSGFGVNTRLPFVEIESPELDKPVQISPNEARDLALSLLEAAEQDAFMFDFAKSTLEQSDEGSANLLIYFREFRKTKLPKRRNDAG